MRTATLIGITGLIWIAPASGQSCNSAESATQNCGSPRVIPGWAGHHVVHMDTASAVGTGNRCGATTGNEVWFEVTPEVSGPMTISTCHPATSFDTVIEAFIGNNCATMIQIDCNDDSSGAECNNGCSGAGSKLTFFAEAGVPYKFVVGSYGQNSGGCAALCLGVIVTIGEPCGDAPSNLTCQLAQELPGARGAYNVQVDVTDALFLPGAEPVMNCGFENGHTVWFKTAPQQDGIARFTTCRSGTSYDTVVQAWVSDDCNTFVNMGCNDDNGDTTCPNMCPLAFARAATVQFDVTAGSTYYFQVGSFEHNSLGCSEPLCLNAEFTLGSVCDFDATAPLVDLTTPAELTQGCVCPPVPISGMVDDSDGNLSRWTVSYRPVGVASYTLIASDTAPVPSAALLATWDTSGLPQGYYVIRLEAVDACGKSSSTERVIWLDQGFDAVEFTPGDNAVVGGDVCLFGTVIDNFCFSHIVPEYRPVGGGAWQPANPDVPTYLTPAINQTFAQWPTFTLGIPDGDYELRTTGYTDCGVGRTETHMVTVDNGPPLMEIIIPLACQHEPFSLMVLGTVQDPHLANWKLEITGGDIDGWQLIGSDTQGLYQATLGFWDPFGHPNCAYVLRLTATETTIVDCDERRQTSIFRTFNLGFCGDFDADDDGDIDLFDFGAFDEAFTGPLP